MGTLDLEIKTEDYQNEFNRIAIELMNRWFLIVDKTRYRIAEIEFYYSAPGHDDVFIHGHDIQKTSGRWYCHPSGIDITIGNGVNSGSILIRAVYNFDEEKYVYGPLNCLRDFFLNFDSVYNSSVSFGLCFDDKDELVPKEVPIATRRFGLRKDKSLEMYDKQYRFLIMPKKKHAHSDEIKKILD